MPRKGRTRAARRWRLLLGRAFVCAALACVVAGCGPSVEELMRQAQDLESRDDLPAAIEALRLAVVRKPANPDARLQLGLMQAKYGDVAAAEGELQRALELGVPVARVLPHLGEVLLELQRYRKLLDGISLPADMPSEDLAVLILQRGRAHLALGETVEARTQFLTAANYRPVEARLGLALLAAVQGDLAGADKLVDDIIAGTPASADAWLVRGDLRQLRGDDRDAAEAYQRAVTLEPANVKGLASHAVLLVRAGDYPAARRLIERAYRLRPADVTVNFARAVLALHAGDFAACREAVDRVQKTVPDHPLSRILDAALLSATGQLEQSEGVLASYLGLYSDDAYARKLLAGMLLIKRMPEQALAVLTPLLENHGEDPEIVALVGHGELQTGLLVAGRDRLKKAVARAPAGARLRTDLGLAYLALGDTRAGIDELRAAARSDGSGFQPDLLLIGTLLGRADEAAAAQAAQALEVKQPQAAATHQIMGAVRLVQGDSAGARSAFERALKVDPAYFPSVGALARLDQRSGAVDSARARLTAFLDRDYSHLQANLALVELEAEQGNWAAAGNRLLLLQQTHPQSESVNVMFAQLQLQAGKTKEAILSAQLALSVGARNSDALETLARAQRAAGDANGAGATLVRLSALYPDSTYPLLLLADAYRAAGQPSLAQAAAAKALELEPDNLGALAALAVQYLGTQQWEKARELAATLQRRYPGRALGYALDGDVRLGQRDHAGAAKAFERAIAVEESGELHAKWHQARSAAAGEFAADSGLLDWLRRNPRDARTRRYIAAAYLDAGRSRDAVGHYRLLVRDNPNDAQALNNLAWALNELGDAQALEYAERAYAQSPQSAPIVDTFGWLLLQQGRKVLALEFLTKAVSLDPVTPAIRYHRAEALHLSGEVAEARKELRRIIETAGTSDYAAKASALLRQIGS